MFESEQNWCLGVGKGVNVISPKSLLQCLLCLLLIMTEANQNHFAVFTVFNMVAKKQVSLLFGCWSAPDRVNISWCARGESAGSLPGIGKSTRWKHTDKWGCETHSHTKNTHATKRGSSQSAYVTDRAGVYIPPHTITGTQCFVTLSQYPSLFDSNWNSDKHAEQTHSATLDTSHSDVAETPASADLNMVSMN